MKKVAPFLLVVFFSFSSFSSFADQPENPCARTYFANAIQIGNDPISGDAFCMDMISDEPELNNNLKGKEAKQVKRMYKKILQNVVPFSDVRMWLHKSDDQQKAHQIGNMRNKKKHPDGLPDVKLVIDVTNPGSNYEQFNNHLVKTIGANNITFCDDDCIGVPGTQHAKGSIFSEVLDPLHKKKKIRWLVIVASGNFGKEYRSFNNAMIFWGSEEFYKAHKRFFNDMYTKDHHSNYTDTVNGNYPNSTYPFPNDHNLKFWFSPGGPHALSNPGSINTPDPFMKLLNGTDCSEGHSGEVLISASYFADQRAINVLNRIKQLLKQGWCSIRMVLRNNPDYNDYVKALKKLQKKYKKKKVEDGETTYAGYYLPKTFEEAEAQLKDEYLNPKNIRINTEIRAELLALQDSEDQRQAKEVLELGQKLAQKNPPPPSAINPLLTTGIPRLKIYLTDADKQDDIGIHDKWFIVNGWLKAFGKPEEEGHAIRSVFIGGNPNIKDSSAEDNQEETFRYEEPPGNNPILTRVRQAFINEKNVAYCVLHKKAKLCEDKDLP